MILTSAPRSNPPIAPNPGTSMPARARQRGRRAFHSGRAAEEIAMRAYVTKGATVLEERWRCPDGELDLVVQEGEVLVFVEVKQRKSWANWDSAVSAAQWRRLEAAASQYILQHQADTGIQPYCRFDVALIGHDGAATLIENAWSCLN